MSLANTHTYTHPISETSHTHTYIAKQILPKVATFTLPQDKSGIACTIKTDTTTTAVTTTTAASLVTNKCPEIE